MTITVGYWDIRGLVAPIRYMLEYAGLQYEDKLYKCGPPPTFEKEEWMQDKVKLAGEMNFPNLPYLIDGDVKISQSDVIMRYLARKLNLNGKNEADQLTAEVLASQIRDYQYAFGMICYNPQFEQLKGDYLKNLPDKLQSLEKFLGEKKFAVGDYITYVDFVLFEYLEAQSNFVEGLLKDYPKLQQFHKNMLALEPMDKYFKSDRVIKSPFNGAPARFGGRYSEMLKGQ